MADTRIPVTLTLHKQSRMLEIGYDDGTVFHLSFEFPRVHSPSAEVRGHGGPKQIVRAKEQVTIRALEPVGNYAVRIVFDDGHDSGLYSWDFLATLGREHDRIWAEYQQAVKG